ncbi:putative ankyrin repeat protein RF_0381 [Lineus longissimus]|uniref:putative ankyrin repeat protein RF_0381 n=1 Tax=Lineus longissimus TaxID=88925 RepID=UPI002B4FB223
MSFRPLDTTTWTKFQEAAKSHRDLEMAKSVLSPGMDLNSSMGITGTPLCAAIEAGALELVQKLLLLGCDVNKNNEDGESPLSLAIRKKNVTMIILLIEAGSNVSNDQSKLGDLPLCDAVRFNWFSVVEKLLEFGAEVNALNYDCDSALHLSVSLGHRKMTGLLLAHGADPLAYNNNGESSVHVAAMMGDFRAIETIVRFAKTHQDLDASLSSSKNERCPLAAKYLDHKQGLTGRTSLHIGVTNSCVEIVEYLIKAGCNVNACSNDGETPLSLACCDSNSYLVKLLVEAGCNVNAPAFDRMHLRFRTLSSKTYPLLIAVCKGSLPIFKCLIEAGADINSVNEKENSSLSIALRLICTDIVDYILNVGREKGLDLKTIIKKKHGRNPLLDVVNLGYDAPSVAEKLIDLGCPLDCSGRNNYMSPLHAAVEQECLDLMRTLLSHGADMRLYDRDGHMPLHLCAIYGLEGPLQVLLENGADVNWRAEDGDCSLVLAIANCNSHIIELLVRGGHRLPVYPFLEEVEMCEELKVSDICNVQDLVELLLHVELEKEEPELFQLMKSMSRLPASLAQHSTRAIRNYFVTRQIPLNKIEQVVLPSSLKSMIQMKDFLEI